MTSPTFGCERWEWSCDQAKELLWKRRHGDISLQHPSALGWSGTAALRRLSALLASAIFCAPVPSTAQEPQHRDSVCSSTSKSDSADLIVQFPLFLFVGNSIFSASLFHGRTQSSINLGDKQMVLTATPGFLLRSPHCPMLHFAVLQVHSAEQLELTFLL